jgi:hypothetical protein
MGQCLSTSSQQQPPIGVHEALEDHAKPASCVPTAATVEGGNGSREREHGTESMLGESRQGQHAVGAHAIRGQPNPQELPASQDDAQEVRMSVCSD